MCAHLYCVYKPSIPYFSCNGANEKSRLKNKIMSLIYYTPRPAKRSREVFSVYLLLLFIYPFAFLFASLHDTRGYIRFCETPMTKKVGIKKKKTVLESLQLFAGRRTRGWVSLL